MAFDVPNTGFGDPEGDRAVRPAVPLNIDCDHGVLSDDPVALLGNTGHPGGLGGVLRPGLSQHGVAPVRSIEFRISGGCPRRPGGGEGMNEITSLPTISLSPIIARTVPGARPLASRALGAHGVGPRLTNVRTGRAPAGRSDARVGSVGLMGQGVDPLARIIIQSDAVMRTGVETAIVRTIAKAGVVVCDNRRKHAVQAAKFRIAYLSGRPSVSDPGGVAIGGGILRAKVAVRPVASPTL